MMIVVLDRDSSSNTMMSEVRRRQLLQEEDDDEGDVVVSESSWPAQRTEPSNDDRGVKIESRKKYIIFYLQKKQGMMIWTLHFIDEDDDPTYYCSDLRVYTMPRLYNTKDDSMMQGSTVFFT